MPEESHKRSLWVGIGEKVISFVVGLVIASFFLGGARQRVNTLGKEMDAWKIEWKERNQQITRMDLEGSVATKNFITHYEKEQKEQYERLKHVEMQVAHLPTIELKIERLEKKIGADP